MAKVLKDFTTTSRRFKAGADATADEVGADRFKALQDAGAIEAPPTAKKPVAPPAPDEEPGK